MSELAAAAGDGRTFFAGLAYRVGTPTPLAVLERSAGASPEVLDALRARGLAQFCRNDGALSDLCVLSAQESLLRTGLSPSDIDVIVFANSNAEWSGDDEQRLLAAFHQAGFEYPEIVGVGLQGCSVCGAALRAAHDLLATRGRERRVLVIVCGQRHDGTRIGLQGTTVFSDGAATCIVSSSPGEFQLLACESRTSPRLAGIERSPRHAAIHMEGGVRSIATTTQNVLRQSGVEPKQIKAVLGTNGSQAYLDFIASAAGVPMDRVYRRDVARYGHVHACDNLLSLRNRHEEEALAPGDVCLLLGWSPYVVSASVVRRVG